MSDLYGIEHLPLPTAAEMDALDRRAQQELGVPERVLMEAAGRGIASVVHSLFPQGRVAGAIGSGHNGGDTLIALRVLRAWGRELSVVVVAPGAVSAELRHGWDVPGHPPDEAASVFASSDVIIDGVLGTGSKGAPRGGHAALVDAINASGRPVVAVDGPSGIDFTTGEVPGSCVQAAVTVALGYPKRGCLFQPARGRCGRLLVAEIGFPPVSEGSVRARVITPAWARARLPARPPDAHKRSAGYLLIVAGARGMAGAAALAARAALRAGVGLVRVASDSSNREILQSLVPEAIFVDADERDLLKESCAWADAVVAGPGLGRGATSRTRLSEALEHADAKPILLDADALNILSERPGDLEALGRARPLALTPHPGEASRLTGRSVAEIRKDAIAVAEALAERYRAAILLKGAPSVVASPDLPTLVTSSGTSAVATGGSGDVLSGCCGAMLAAGLSPRDALGVGLFYAGRSSELLPRRRGVTSLDLAEALPLALANPGAAGPPPGLPFVIFDQASRE